MHIACCWAFHGGFCRWLATSFSFFVFLHVIPGESRWLVIVRRSTCWISFLFCKCPENPRLSRRSGYVRFLDISDFSIVTGRRTLIIHFLQICHFWKNFNMSVYFLLFLGWLQIYLVIYLNSQQVKFTICDLVGSGSTLVCPSLDGLDKCLALLRFQYSLHRHSRTSLGSTDITLICLKNRTHLRPKDRTRLCLKNRTPVRVEDRTWKLLQSSNPTSRFCST